MTARIQTLATSLVLALSLAACGGLMEGNDFEDRELGPCPTGLAAWAPGTFYPAGTQVTFQGGFFQSVQTHTAFDPAWTPVAVPALWSPVSCQGNPAGGGGGDTGNNNNGGVDNGGNNGGGDTGGGDTGGGGEDPPPPPPPGGNAGNATPPAPGCDADGRPGPLFDPFGADEVGNGRGLSFITGRCLSAADCGSGCCALPCGICSGVGAQFQAGKQGCGFVR